MIDIIFETGINLIQSVLVTIFLVYILECKKQYNKTRVCLLGIAITFVYLMISNSVVYFESVGIFIYMIYTIVFSFIALNGSVIEKIFYNSMIICCIVGSSLLGGGVISIAVKKDFLNSHLYGTKERYIGAILVQAILLFLFFALSKLKQILKYNDQKFMFTASIIPIISVFVCCFMVFRSDVSYTRNVIYTYIATVGVVLVNVICIILLVIEHRIHEQKMIQQIMISAYQQKEKDVAAILDIHMQNSKQRHDVKNIMTLIKDLIHNQQYEKAIEMLDKYDKGQNSVKITEIVSDNVVLNYLLNRKISQCDKMGIDFSCYVLGKVTGVDDLDMYILLENLCDNAIEAAALCNEACIKLQLSSDVDCIYIDIGNTTNKNVLRDNPYMDTTKQDKELHGFGIKNIKDVIKKYRGSIKYDQLGDNYIVCKCCLYKE